MLSALMAIEHNTVYLLTRARSQSFLRDLISTLKLKTQSRANVIILNGDLVQPMCGLSRTTCNELKIDHVVHCAADVRWGAEANDLIDTNLKGGKNLLNLCEYLHLRHPLTRVSVTSTAFVSGAKSPKFVNEQQLNTKHFNNPYEVSKFLLESDCLRRRLPITIVRPSIIVGDSKTGEIENYSALYFPIKLAYRRALPVVPANKKCKIDIVTVDYVRDVILAVHQSCHDFKIVHACAGNNSISIQEFWDESTRYVNDHMCPTPPYKVGKFVGRFALDLAVKFPGLIPPRQRRLLDRASEYIPYMNMNRQFETTNASVLGVEPLASFRDWLGPVLRYAINNNFQSSRKLASISK